MSKRAILIVLDSVGIGALPDAAEFNDVGANTLGHIEERHPLNIPNMRKLEYMLVPRICALAEIAWLPREARPGEVHLGQRIQQHHAWFDSMKINFRQEDGMPRQD